MDEPIQIPLAARFGHDFAQLLIYVEPADEMRTVAEKVAHHVVGKRVRPRDSDMGVYYEGRLLPANTTVEQAGFQRLDYIAVDYV